MQITEISPIFDTNFDIQAPSVMAPPQAGNEILIPLFDAETAGKPSTVDWSQNHSTHTATYYPLAVDNITTGEQCALFIAAELYKSTTTANPKHITHVGTLVSGGKVQRNNPTLTPISRNPFTKVYILSKTEGYKMTIDSSFQYGQKNAKGDLRFLVYHDKERRPYQHRFIETALGSTIASGAKKTAELLGKGVSPVDVGAITTKVTTIAKQFVGDYLRDF